MVPRPRPRGGDPAGRRNRAAADRPGDPEPETDSLALVPHVDPPAVPEDLRKDVRELREQIESLRETFSKVARPYAELVGYVEQLQRLSRGYVRILDLVQRYGAVSPGLAVPEVKDDISRHIVAVLLERRDRNVSQVTDAVKERRGGAPPPGRPGGPAGGAGPRVRARVFGGR